MSLTSGTTSATSVTVRDCHSYWPLPHDEEERFKTVLAFKVLDTQEDPVLQSLCVLARTLMGTCFAGKPLPPCRAPCPGLSIHAIAMHAPCSVMDGATVDSQIAHQSTGCCS